jgi:uracil DNA glycosylase
VINWIPHLSDLPAKLRTAINQAYYSGNLRPNKSQIFHTFFTADIKQVQLIIILGPGEDIPNISLPPYYWKINCPLTWVSGNNNIHRNLGWEQIVTDMIKLVDNLNRYKVYMLIGGPAQSFKQVINKTNLIIELAQPSDLTETVMDQVTDFIERKKNV